MKAILVLSILSSILFASAKLEHVTIGNQDFSIVTESYKIYDSKGEVMKFYKEERNNNLTFVLSLILKDDTGSCSDKSMERGSYEIYQIWYCRVYEYHEGWLSVGGRWKLLST